MWLDEFVDQNIEFDAYEFEVKNHVIYIFILVSKIIIKFEPTIF